MRSPPCLNNASTQVGSLKPITDYPFHHDAKTSKILWDVRKVRGVKGVRLMRYESCSRYVKSVRQDPGVERREVIEVYVSFTSNYKNKV